MSDFIQLLKEADEIVKSKPTYKRFIDGTPLSNDIAVWMAEFAMEQHDTSTLDELRKDAERYRWLRDKHGVWFPPANDWFGGEDVDAAIDAAMKGQPCPI